MRVLDFSDGWSSVGAPSTAGAWTAPDGTVSAPGISFNSDADTGFYRSASNTISVAIGGANLGDISSSGWVIKTGLAMGSTPTSSNILDFRKDQAAATRGQIRNYSTSASAYARWTIGSDAGDINIDANSVAGSALADFRVDAAFTAGLRIVTLGSTVLALATNSTTRFSIAGTGTITASAPLEISGTTSYLKVVSLNSTQRDALTAATGMVVYNSTASKLQVYSGGSWTDLH